MPEKMTVESGTFDHEFDVEDWASPNWFYVDAGKWVETLAVMSFHEWEWE